MIIMYFESKVWNRKVTKMDFLDGRQAGWCCKARSEVRWKL